MGRERDIEEVEEVVSIRERGERERETRSRRDGWFFGSKIVVNSSSCFIFAGT